MQRYYFRLLFSCYVEYAFDSVYRYRCSHPVNPFPMDRALRGYYVSPNVWIQNEKQLRLVVTSIDSGYEVANIGKSTAPLALRLVGNKLEETGRTRGMAKAVVPSPTVFLRSGFVPGGASRPTLPFSCSNKLAERSKVLNFSFRRR